MAVEFRERTAFSEGKDAIIYDRMTVCRNFQIDECLSHDCGCAIPKRIPRHNYCLIAVLVQGLEHIVGELACQNLP